MGSAKTDKDKVYFGNFDSSHRGPPRIVRFGEKDFFYFPAGDGVAVYRIDPPEDESRGPTLKLVAALAGAEPLPDGTVPKEPWRAGKPVPVVLARRAGRQPAAGGGNYHCLPRPRIPRIGNGRWAESPSMKRAGFGLLLTCADLRIQGRSRPFRPSLLKGQTSLGNPVYDWNSAIRVVSDQAGPGALGISKGDDSSGSWSGVPSSDGMIYGLANTKKPGAPQEGGMHMGGNVLMGFQERNAESPDEITRAQMVGGAAEEDGRLGSHSGWEGRSLIGGDPWRGGVRHYTKDGLLIGGFQSDPRFGSPAS